MNSDVEQKVEVTEVVRRLQIRRDAAQLALDYRREQGDESAEMAHGIGYVRGLNEALSLLDVGTGLKWGELHE